MSLNLMMPTQADDELRPRITVFGVGGAGGNAVNNMIRKELEGADFVVANTDAQALQQSSASRRIQLGASVTQGLGAGAKPEVGNAAAEESLKEIIEHLQGSHMCFITAGMGGGTGTGAAPVVARAARELGILTVGVVTKPFTFEGPRRMKQADAGLAELKEMVDTLIVIPNQNLFRMATENTSFAEAFIMADDVLYQGVQGITDLMVRPGMINLDFADVRSVMDEMGQAMMGSGEASGEGRAIAAAELAIANPLLDEISLKGAKGVLVNVTAGFDLTMYEMDEANNRIRKEVDEGANIIVGTTLDPEMDGTMRVTVVATGIGEDEGDGGRKPIVENNADTTATMTPAATPQPTHSPATPVMTSPEIAPVAPTAPMQEPLPTYEKHATANRAERDGVFVPPRPAMPGEASEEVRNRLKAAVHKPVADAPRTTATAGIAPAPRPQNTAPVTTLRPPVEPTVAPTASPASPNAERARFGINSLIGRMTGNNAPAATGTDGGGNSGHNAGDDDRQREIPAFLRRQAN